MPSTAGHWVLLSVASIAALVSCKKPEPAVPHEREPQAEAKPEAAPHEPEVAATPEPSLPIAYVHEPLLPPEVPADQRLDAPPRYERLAIRAALPIGPRYGDLLYEGNNKHFRGPLDAKGLYRSGAKTAADWRAYAAGTGALIVLRDSLFSQQDHPTLQAPSSLMMPPMWVSVAVAETLAGRPLTTPRSAEIDDDAAWAGDDIQAYFGSFPVSERLFGDARRALAGASEAEAAQTRNARRSMRMLAASAQAMADVAERGPEAVAAVGADRIAASDRSYFGSALRKNKIIPIFVEHPNEHESRDEGKGMVPWGVALPDEAVGLARRAIYGRRLEDGAIALERYDLRSEADRKRAIALLEELVPTGSRGALVYLWVNGGSDGHGKGEPATPHIPAFQAELEGAAVAFERVVLFSKPSVRPWGDEGSAILEAAVDRHTALGVPLSAQLRTGQLQKLLEARGK